jgi:predicted RNA-binding Zn-ribbon protein involved in translation (DUF1610 family)
MKVNIVKLCTVCKKKKPLSGFRRSQFRCRECIDKAKTSMEIRFKNVVVESPYAGDTERNLRYLRACFCDCLRRVEAPIASHKLYADLCFGIGLDRELGIEAGYAWGIMADYVVCYVDLGMTDGMKKAIKSYEDVGLKTKYRSIAYFNEEVLLVPDCSNCGLPIDSMSNGEPTVFHVCPNCGQKLEEPVLTGQPIEDLDDGPPKEYKTLIEG